MDAEALDPTSPGAIVTESDQQAVRRSEAERYAAMTAADWSRFADLCDPDLLYTHSSGQTDTLDSYLAKVTEGIFVYHRIDHPIDKVLIRGDVAMVLGEMNAHISSHGVEKDLRNKCLAVWIRAGASWQLIAYQPTPVA
jgi:ketosteroid isomerase-like protein